MIISPGNNVPVIRRPEQVLAVHVHREVPPHGFMSPSVTPIIQHLISSASFGHAPLVYTPSKLLQVEVRIQIPFLFWISDASLPVQRPLRVAMAERGKMVRKKMGRMIAYEIVFLCPWEIVKMMDDYDVRCNDMHSIGATYSRLSADVGLDFLEYHFSN